MNISAEKFGGVLAEMVKSYIERRIGKDDGKSIREALDDMERRQMELARRISDLEGSAKADRPRVRIAAGSERI
ncbi:hypothetical protein EDE05_11446 [Neorhizobium sp. R1-B]|uniref:hypothetical protein n=1 Tax=Neorhizobium sp. R1-B TaxID=2485162 RepID=UPI001064ECC8|nr:hypothetical protein [Neorhizobium sp. R1-B]TDX77737.1 hypothetical protein EDE05_11446 [Neorhizobium sp. R1-B]